MLRLLTGVGISGVALWWAFRAMDWQAFSQAISSGDAGLLAMSVIMLLLGVPMRGYRWAIFMRPIKETSTRQASEATIVGYFGNNVLPFRMGEVVRAYYLSKKTDAKPSQVFGTIILERLIDMFTILVLLLIVPFVAFIPDQLKGATWLAVTGGAVLMIAAWWASRTDDVSWIPVKLRDLAQNLRSGFSSLRESHTILPILVSTIAIWTSYLISIYYAQLSMGLALTWAETFSLFIATTVVIAIPSAPGFVGTYHAMVIFMLVNVMGREMANAQAASVILHAVGFVPYTIIGAILYFGSHMRLSEVRSADSLTETTQ